MSVVAVGCSYTAGSGWDVTSPSNECKDSPNLWINICHDRLWPTTKLINAGKRGASNQDIFTSAIDHLLSGDVKILICQWTGMPRYNWHIGFELWDTSESLVSGQTNHDVNLSNGQTWTRSYIDDLKNRLLVTHHLHWEILNVVRYSNIITKLAKQNNVTVWFINGLCPWDHNYFKRKDNFVPSELSAFTQNEILDWTNRNDQDIVALYNLAHNHYDSAGGIDLHHWINLYQSFKSVTVDCNFDKAHPGLKSNELFAKMVVERISC